MSQNKNAGTMTFSRLLALIWCDVYGRPDYYAPVAEDMFLSAQTDIEKAKWLKTMPMYEAQKRLEIARGQREAHRRLFDAAQAGLDISEFFENT